MVETLSPYLWSTTASDNDDSDPGINWAEGQLPGTVNNSARAEMASIAGLVQDTNGSLASTGSANAYSITPNINYSSLRMGLRLQFRANFSNTGAATLNVNGLGAKAIRVFGVGGDSALIGGELHIGGHYEVVYNTAANSAAGAWILLNPVTSAVVATSIGLADGTVGAPALYWNSDPDTGYYRIGSGDLGLSVNASKVVEWTSGGSAITGLLTVSNGITGTKSADYAVTALSGASGGFGAVGIGRTAVEYTIGVSGGSNQIITGSGSGDVCQYTNSQNMLWSVDNGSSFQMAISGSRKAVMVGAPDVSTLSSGDLAVAGVGQFGGAVYPVTSASNTVALGGSSNRWSDLYLGDGAVINFNADVTVTHGTNTLAFAGASSGYTFDATIAPSANDAGALGVSGTAFSDLFLATGGVINWLAGDVTITHSSNTLSFAGGTSYLFDSLVSATRNDDYGIQVLSSSGHSAIFGVGRTASELGIGVSGGTDSLITGSVAGTVCQYANAAMMWSVNNGSTAQLTISSAGGVMVGSASNPGSGNFAVSGGGTFGGSAGVAARNTAKAFCAVTVNGGGTVTLQSGSFNVATAAAQAAVGGGGSAGFKVTFTNAMSTATYTAVVTVANQGTTDNPYTVAYLGKNASYVEFLVRECSSNNVKTAALDFNVTIYENS